MGGNQYSPAFGDLKTLLSNGRSAFDEQFSEIAKTIQAYQVDYAPLDCQSPVKVFVGSSPNEILAVKILEYSIKKHASLSVEVFPLFEANIDYPMPKDLVNQPRTPFSFQRFLIPELCGYQGRAIYMDADMQVFKDIRSFWRMEFNGADVLTTYKAGDTERRPQFSVIMLNCESLKWQIKDIVQQLDNHELDYAQLMYDFKLGKTIRADIDPSWNSLENYQKNKTALTHYTDMPSQPWISTKNKYTEIWMNDLFEALDSGFIPLDFVDEQIQLGNIRPSLRLQIDRKEPNPKKVPRRLMEELDKDFIAPYQALQYEKATSENSPKKRSLFKKLLRPLVVH